MIRILESRSYLHIVKSKTNKKFWFLGLSRKLYNIYGQTREYNNVITKLKKGKTFTCE